MKLNPRWRRKLSIALVCAITWWMPVTQRIAQAENVHLNYLGVGWPALGTAAAIEGAITSLVMADYAEFPWLTFTSSTGGGGAGLITDTVIEFSEASGSFGSSHLVDWDNKLKAQNNVLKANNTAGAAIDVFVSTFVGIGSPYTDSFAKFTTAIAGTTSHELGHGLGLRHFDTFGPAPVAGNPNPVPDHHIMATGSTGLAGTDRTDYDRVFSEHSRDKLHYLDPLNQPARKRAELLPAAGAHGTFAIAEPLTIGPADLIPAVGRQIMVKDAFLHPGEADYYSFFAVAGDRLYANTFSSRLTGADGTSPGAGFDTVLALHNPLMATVKLNDDIGYNSTSGADPGIGDTVGDPGADLTKLDLLRNEIYSAALESGPLDSPYDTRSTDSIIIDSPSGDYFTITATGIWFLEVFGFTTAETGDYELFVSIERVIPEPGSLALMLLGVCGFLGGRRTRS